MSWKDADRDERSEIIAAITRSHPAFRRDPERCQAASLDLPFYPGARLVRLTARDIPGSTLWYACLPQEAVALAPGPGGLAAINHCNIAAPLVLNDATAAPYLRFRYYFASGARLFEARIKRSAVGYTGKIWVFEQEKFFEIDINLSPRGLVTELEKVRMEDVPDFMPGEFAL